MDRSDYMMGELGFTYQFSLEVCLSVCPCDCAQLCFDWKPCSALLEAADWLQSCLCQLDFNTKPEVMAWQLCFRKWENSFELFIMSIKSQKNSQLQFDATKGDLIKYLVSLTKLH